MASYEDERQSYNLGRYDETGTVHAAYLKVVTLNNSRPWSPFAPCGVQSSQLVRTIRPVTCKRCLAKEPTT